MNFRGRRRYSACPGAAAAADVAYGKESGNRRPHLVVDLDAGELTDEAGDDLEPLRIEGSAFLEYAGLPFQGLRMKLEELPALGSKGVEVGFNGAVAR